MLDLGDGCSRVHRSAHAVAYRSGNREDLLRALRQKNSNCLVKTNAGLLQPTTNGKNLRRQFTVTENDAI